MKSDGKWKLLGKKYVFDSKWMSIEDRSYELPDGKKVEGYFHLNRPDYVLILAIDEQNRLVVEKQYRRGVDDFVYELPAGWIEQEERPTEAAVRELKEETGFVGTCDFFQEIYPQPGFSSMKAYVAIVKIQKHEQDSMEADENIKFEMKDLDNVKRMVKDGEIKDMGFLSALEVYSEKNS